MTDPSLASALFILITVSKGSKALGCLPLLLPLQSQARSLTSGSLKSQVSLWPDDAAQSLRVIHAEIARGFLVICEFNCRGCVIITRGTGLRLQRSMCNQRGR